MSLLHNCRERETDLLWKVRTVWFLLPRDACFHVCCSQDALRFGALPALPAKPPKTWSVPVPPRDGLHPSHHHVHQGVLTSALWHQSTTTKLLRAARFYANISYCCSLFLSFFSRSVGQSVDWLVGRLVGRSVGWSAEGNLCTDCLCSSNIKHLSPNYDRDNHTGPSITGFIAYRQIKEVKPSQVS